jgi:DNA polymerase III delta prime subunit
MNELLGRTAIENNIISILNNFDKMHKDINYKKGIYLYGSSGVGKTTFILEILNKLGYDVIHYDAGDVRNKALIENIASNNIATQNVLDMMHKRVKKIAILMDEIDGMNSGDKGGLTALIKLIRQKKTKKQRLENMTLNPIICIGNYNMDKKIKELMKVCNVFEIKQPTPEQMEKLIRSSMPKIIDTKQIVNYTLGDLRKLEFVKRLYASNHDVSVISNILNSKTFNDDTNKITKALLKTKFAFEDHNMLMNETDRTTVALLWHENVVDALYKGPKGPKDPTYKDPNPTYKGPKDPTYKDPDPEQALDFYLKFLDNICFSDYIDRITFQNQIWHFNEMSSLIKTFYNNKLFHEYRPGGACIEDVRFTKVLTKYSTEYNNTEFIYDMCQKLDMDKKDMLAFFQELRLFYGSKGLDIANDTAVLNTIDTYFENYDITKLDVRRIYRFLDCNVKKDIEIGTGFADIDDE